MSTVVEKTNEEKYAELVKKYGDEAIEDARQWLYVSGVPHISDEELPMYVDELTELLEEHYDEIRIPHR